MYVGYTSTLASFLSLEFNRLNQSEDSEKTQVGHSAGASVQTSILLSFFSSVCSPLSYIWQSVQVEREEMKLLSLLLAPVTRIHSYLSHIQVSRQPTRGRRVSHRSSADAQNLIEVANPAHTGSKFWTLAIMGPHIMDTCSQSANQYDVTVWTN